MSGYGPFSYFYDRLTLNISYKDRAEYFDRLIKLHGGRKNLLLDLACGTGSLSEEFAKMGYDVIATDISQEMLNCALDKKFESGLPIQYLCQDMTELDMFGTIDVTICALDSLNHLSSKEDMQKAINKVSLFCEPGGLFIFDVNTPYKLRRMDGQVYLDETEDSYCVWRTFYAPGRKICTYQVDLFQRNGDGTWDRAFEEHRERAWEREELEADLAEAGFGPVTVTGDLTGRPPAPEEDRWNFRCQKPVNSK